MKTQRPYLKWLIIGDVLAVLIATTLGFITHYGEGPLKAELGARWLASFFPILAAWFLVAPWLGVYDRELSPRSGQVWRVLLAAVFSAPLAATLRGIWLNSVIAPVFVLVMMATNGLGFVVWRWLWTRFARRTAVYG
jgi:hypothetical protein